MAGSITTTPPVIELPPGSSPSSIAKGDKGATGDKGDKGDTGSAATAASAALWQGRISLTSGAPLIGSDVTGATTIYWVPDGGSSMVVSKNGTTLDVVTVSQLSLVLDGNSAHQGYQARAKNVDVWYAHVAGIYYFGTGPAWNDGAVAGSNVARGTGAGSTDWEYLLGVPVNKNAMVLRFGANAGDVVTVSAHQATLLGTIRMMASLDGVTEDSQLRRFVSNLYRRERRRLSVSDPSSTPWAYNGVYRQVNANPANQVEYVHCVAGLLVEANHLALAYNSTATARPIHAGIGIDSTSIDSSTISTFAAVALIAYPAIARYKGSPGLGYHRIVPLEKGDATGGDTQNWLGTGYAGTTSRTGMDAEIDN